MSSNEFQISWNKLLLIADQVMVSGSNFLLGILLVRSLGLESYGIFAVLWMVILFGLSINHAFITKPILSIVPKMESTKGRMYLQNVQCLQGVLSFLFFLIGIGFWLSLIHI